MRFDWRLPSHMAVLMVGLGLGAVGVATSRAQQQPAAPPARANLSVMIKGAQRALTDTVRGVMLEYDPPKQMDLVIIGSKGKGQFTCELHSASRETLLGIQRTLLEASDISVTCANGTPSTRGGVIIDLDDPRDGSFVLNAQRPGP